MTTTPIETTHFADTSPARQAAKGFSAIGRAAKHVFAISTAVVAFVLVVVSAAVMASTWDGVSLFLGRSRLLLQPGAALPELPPGVVFAQAVFVVDGELRLSSVASLRIESP